MSNLIKLVCVLVVVVLGVIFRKRIHARSKKMYGTTKGFVKKQKAKLDAYRAKQRAVKAQEERKVSYI